MQLRLEMSLFLVVLVAIGNTARGGPACEISWSSAVIQTEAILRKDCGDKCVEVARQDVAVCNCKFFVSSQVLQHLLTTPELHNATVALYLWKPSAWVWRGVCC